MSALVIEAAAVLGVWVLAVRRICTLRRQSHDAALAREFDELVRAERYK